uniref:Uncharacterized protein n=1 Tax=Cacopsylla melanoneura TaxID=428564 RepID=A0A8D8TUV8_9HEMI
MVWVCHQCHYCHDSSTMFDFCKTISIHLVPKYLHTMFIKNIQYPEHDSIDDDVIPLVCLDQLVRSIVSLFCSSSSSSSFFFFSLPPFFFFFFFFPPPPPPPPSPPPPPPPFPPPPPPPSPPPPPPPLSPPPPPPLLPPPPPPPLPPPPPPPFSPPPPPPLFFFFFLYVVCTTDVHLDWTIGIFGFMVLVRIFCHQCQVHFGSP